MAVDIIKQMQQSRESYWTERRAKESGKTTTSTTTTGTSSSGAAYNVNISTANNTAAASKSQSLTAKYGGVYTSSPNGEKLAKLRAENEARVKDKLPVAKTPDGSAG